MKKLLVSSVALLALLLSSIPAPAAQAESSKFRVTIPALESMATPGGITIALSASDTFAESAPISICGRANYFWKLNLHRSDREHDPASIILQFKGGEMTAYKDVPNGASPAALIAGNGGHASITRLQFRARAGSGAKWQDCCCDVMLTLTTSE